MEAKRVRCGAVKSGAMLTPRFQDIVDTVKSSQNSNYDDGELVKKILLGGVNRFYDRQNTDRRRKRNH